MTPTEIIATTAQRYAILRRLTEPGIGDRHAAVVPLSMHLAFSLTHWAIEHDGSDRAAWESAAKAFGIEVPAT